MTDTREELLAQRAEIDAKLAALDAQPDPLLAEAREIAATAWSHDAEDYRSGQYDDTSEVCALLAALRRGMELIPAPPPMGEDEIEALVDEALRAAKKDAITPNNACVARHAIRRADGKTYAEVRPTYQRKEWKNG